MPSEDNINAAFSKQSSHFDEDDCTNSVLQQWRKKIYAHIDQFLKPNSTILELNAGTGIDAVRLASRGHRVHATDLSDGMIAQLEKMAIAWSEKITVQQISFQNLSEVNGKFDFVFSNFGGLNCADDLTKVAHELPRLLNPGAYLTWVIMPPVCPWELSWILKGQFKKAFRRLKGKTTAHLESEFFTTYYHSLRDVKSALGPRFMLLMAEGLGIFSPPPAAANFVKDHPMVTQFLNRLDQLFHKNFPFNRCGDHIVVSFRFNF